MTNPSVQQAWMLENCTVQQQSVLLCAVRGPDGIPKHHPVKKIIRVYRACVLNAASTGQPIGLDNPGDSFMSMLDIHNEANWNVAVRSYFNHVDGVPHHYHLHLLHGAQILGYKYPNTRIANAWYTFYLDTVDDMHLYPESEHQMDERLSDFGRMD